MRSRSRYYYFLVLALVIGTGLALAIPFLLGQGSQNFVAYIGIGFGVLGATVAAFQLGGRSVSRKLRVALVGTPGAGKTIYLTALFDSLQTAQDLSFGFAPTTETINRVLETIGALTLGNWAASTPSDYLYLYSARFSPRQRGFGISRFTSVEYQVEFADVAGEQVAEFVPGEKQWLQRTSYYRYALESGALFLFLDYPAVYLGKETNGRSLSEQVNDLIFVIQAVAEASGAGPGKPLEKPVVIIITKCDLAYEVRTADNNNKMLALRNVTRELTGTGDRLDYIKIGPQPDFGRLLAVARARCKYLAVFGVSAVGPVDDDGRPPSPIQPTNVTPALDWMLTTAQRGRAPRVLPQSEAVH